MLVNTVRHGLSLELCRKKKIESFETWLYRRMLGISCKEKVAKEEVYSRISIRKVLMIALVRRQMSFLGHILRKYEQENIHMVEEAGEKFSYVSRPDNTETTNRAATTC